MPFQSAAQRRFMWLTHPDIAKRWTAEHGSAIQRKLKGTQKPQRLRKRRLHPRGVS